MKRIIVLATLALLTASQAMAQQAQTNGNQQKSQSDVEQMHEGNGSNHSN